MGFAMFKMGSREEIKGEVDVEYASVCAVNKVAKLNHNELGFGKEGGVFCDIFLDLPEDALSGRLCSAGTEKLDATKPDGRNAVILAADGGPTPCEDYVGPMGGAIAGRRRRGGVVCHGRGEGEGVGKRVLEDKKGRAGVMGRGVKGGAYLKEGEWMLLLLLAFLHRYRPVHSY